MNNKYHSIHLFRNRTRNQKLMLAGVLFPALMFVAGLFLGQKSQKIEIVNSDSIGSAIADRLMLIQMPYLNSSTNFTVVDGRHFDRTKIDTYTQEEIDAWSKKFFDDHRYDLAFSVCKSAAERGDAVGQYNLANMYYSGKGVVRDDRQFFLWSRKAADQGLPEAQYNLGIAYFRAIGTERNINRARQCIIASAENGYANAQSLLGFLYVFGAGFGLKQDYDLAYKYMEKAAEQKFPLAYCQLGWMHIFGLGCDKDFVRAKELFQKADGVGDGTVREISRRMADLIVECEKGVE